ncbi:MAG: GNAT family N-acetyltransferase [Cryobacterium sp.]|nr:GNAT family N-acetyltransferase [Oligoflexia bacterium]
MSSFPRLETKTLVLEELRESDASGVYRYASNQKVANTAIWNAHRDIQESLSYIQTLKNQISFEAGNIFLAWGVKEKGAPEIIGSVTFLELGPIRAQIGFVFHSDHWVSPNPAEALKLVIDWAFESFPQFERIQGRCMPHNASSTEILNRLGLQFEGVNHAMVKIRGEIMDLSCHAITRTQWRNRKREEGGWKIPPQSEGHI